MNNEELEQKVKRLEEQITKLRFKILESKAEKKPYRVEVPEDVENYYYVDELGGIYLVKEILNFDEYEYELIYQRGLVFKTTEEAERYDRERILLFKLHKWAEEHNGGWTPNWSDNGESKHYVGYDYEEKELIVSFTYEWQNFTKIPVFKSEEIAEQFIEEFGEEIKEVLC